MIADLDDTLKQLLTDEFPIRNGEIDIRFDQPKREWSSRLTKPTINFFLYDVRENQALRQHQWERVRNGTNRGRLDTAMLKRTPYRLDCLYMLTTWANEPEDEHRLLSSTLAALFRFPKIPRERLEGALVNQPYDIHMALARQDRLTNPAEVWGALDNELRPSISVIFTLAVDPWVEMPVPLTSTFIMQTGQSDPDEESITEGAENQPNLSIRGTVTSKKEPETPLPGLSVALKDTGYMTMTDGEGRFAFSKLQTGPYTLMVLPEKGKLVEFEIEVPSEEGNYNLEM